MFIYFPAIKFSFLSIFSPKGVSVYLRIVNSAVDSASETLIGCAPVG